jgi:hypothetical protein
VSELANRPSSVRIENKNRPSIGGAVAVRFDRDTHSMQGLKRTSRY